MGRFLLFAYLLFLVFPFTGEAVITFSDPNLNQYDQTEVAFAGFLVCDSENHFFLSPEPNLKTCCVGKHEQIALSGIFSKDQLNQLVKARGMFSLDSESRKFSIENAVLVQEKKKIPFFLIGTLLLIATIIVYTLSARKTLR